MAQAFKKGDTVKQIVPIIQGQVITLGIIDDEVQFLVEWTNAEGHVEQRYFKEEEIEVA
jgi:hypothetical protein